jgi:hypothetical protein
MTHPAIATITAMAAKRSMLPRHAIGRIEDAALGASAAIAPARSASAAPSLPSRPDGGAGDGGTERAAGACEGDGAARNGASEGRPAIMRRTSPSIACALS